MEADGVGRPSTYASIIGTIQDRGYVIKAGTQLRPTFLGMAVTQLLEQHFPNLVDETFGDAVQYEVDLVDAIPQEASGKYRFCISKVALEHLQDGGRLVVEGYAGDPGTLPLGADQLCVRSLQLIGINGWTRHDYEAVAALAAARQIDLSGIPVAQFPLRQHDAAVRAAHDNRGILRVMFQPNG